MRSDSTAEGLDNDFDVFGVGIRYDTGKSRTASKSESSAEVDTSPVAETDM